MAERSAALPLALRNRLAELIVDALHDERARRQLAGLARACGEPLRPEPADEAAPLPGDLLEPGETAPVVRRELAPHAATLCERARRGWAAVGARPLDTEPASLAVALESAAALFDAGLFFEVHERLEPPWMSAEGAEREALQGLIQVAVGFHHLGNGNLRGARDLLAAGADKLVERRLCGADLTAFAARVRGCEAAIAGLGAAAGSRFDWRNVPAFPRTA